MSVVYLVSSVYNVWWKTYQVHSNHDFEKGEAFLIFFKVLLYKRVVTVVYLDESLA